MASAPVPDGAGPRPRILARRRPMNGDFDRFYQDEFAAMVSLAHTITGDAALGEDLAQEAMSRAHQNWSRIGGYDKPGAWLRRVTINLALSRRRRLAREIVGLRLVGREPTTEPTGTLDRDREVWDAVATLPPRQRAVVALFYQEDLGTSEIAEILGCSVSATTSHLSQARRKLAQILGEPLETQALATEAPEEPGDRTGERR